MAYQDWQDKTESFFKIDVRKLQGNFFPGLKKKADALEVGEGLLVIQTFEPYPLYEALGQIGFEHHTEQKGEHEYYVYFYRSEKKEPDIEAPFRPIALLNYPLIDEDLGKLTAEFWNLTWKSENRTLPYEMRLLLSLANAVGAGRLRQATRELIKAYVHGVSSAVLDDVFELLVWNQGVGHFSSEIGPSTLFQAYKLIKMNEKRGRSREEISRMLEEKFGEQHPEVKV